MSLSIESLDEHDFDLCLKFAWWLDVSLNTTRDHHIRTNGYLINILSGNWRQYFTKPFFRAAYEMGGQNEITPVNIGSFTFPMSTVITNYFHLYDDHIEEAMKAIPKMKIKSQRSIDVFVQMIENEEFALENVSTIDMLGVVELILGFGICKEDDLSCRNDDAETMGDYLCYIKSQPNIREVIEIYNKRCNTKDDLVPITFFPSRNWFSYKNFDLTHNGIDYCNDELETAFGFILKYGIRLLSDEELELFKKKILHLCSRSEGCNIDPESTESIRSLFRIIHSYSDFNDISEEIIFRLDNLVEGIKEFDPFPNHRVVQEEPTSKFVYCQGISCPVCRSVSIVPQVLRINIGKHNCPVCLEDVNVEEKPLLAMSCGHVICESCVKQIVDITSDEEN